MFRCVHLCILENLKTFEHYKTLTLRPYVVFLCRMALGSSLLFSGFQLLICQRQDGTIGLHVQWATNMCICFRLQGLVTFKKMDEDSTDQEILLKGHLFHGWEFQGLEREGMTWSSFSLHMVFSCGEFRSHLRHSIIKAVAVIAVYSIGDLVLLSIKWERQPCPPYSVRDASSNLVWKPNEGWMGLNPSYSSFLPGPWFLAQGTAHNDTY